MERKVDPNLNIHLEKLTNLPFDDVIGHAVCKRKYFTIENNDIIYKRMREELNLSYLPYLGVRVDFGMGDLVLEEDNNVFRVYSIDRMSKFGLKEYDNVVDAIERLILEYDYEDVDKTMLKNIFFETLNLEKNKVKTMVR